MPAKLREGEGEGEGEGERPLDRPMGGRMLASSTRVFKSSDSMAQADTRPGLCGSRAHTSPAGSAAATAANDGLNKSVSVPSSIRETKVGETTNVWALVSLGMPSLVLYEPPTLPACTPALCCTGLDVSLTRAQHGEEESNIKTEDGAARRTALSAEAQKRKRAGHTLGMKPPATGSAPTNKQSETELSEGLRGTIEQTVGSECEAREHRARGCRAFFFLPVFRLRP